MMRRLLLLLSAGLVAAENGLDGWLRYAPLPGASRYLHDLPSSIVALNASETSPVLVAGTELRRGLQGIFGKHVSISHQDCNASSSIVVGTVDEYSKLCGSTAALPELDQDGFLLNTKGNTVQISAVTSAVRSMAGAFEYLSMLAQGNFSQVAYASNPRAPIRWVNQWDNLDGSIERGYGGASIFFENGSVVSNLTRAAQYARLLASIGVNAVVVNNVNANASILTADNIDGLGRIADVFRPYGVQLAISLNFASPTIIGGLNTFDPLDPSVIAWWTNVTDNFTAHPDMAGYPVKADSEGQPGPLTYNRTLAKEPPFFAKVLQPHGGMVMFRALVYNQLNESDWKADRAKAAVDFFQGLDGQFDDNVVVQIKYGPIDFQVREPTPPLFAHLRNTSTAIELEVTQEYLGQQCHLVYLPPLLEDRPSALTSGVNQESRRLVRNIITGQRFNRTLGGAAAVVNVGTNTTWLGSHLAMSNLYAYGRLAWDPASDAERVLQDWIRLTFGQDRSVIDTITQMSMESWPAYENYSGNLGIQTLTDILYTHFGPNPASQDNNGWGQWTRADHTTIGMDRTVWNGTGYTGQYPPEVAAMYENIDTTPDDLLLWFHHVNYTHRLHSGKTVIQHFYDAHYRGAETAQTFLTMWEALKGKIDSERYNDVHFRLTYQAGHSIVWRDAITNFYFNLSGIPDEAGRVDHHPWRVEAESMTLSGCKTYAVSPFETAFNTTAIVTSTNSTVGTATTKLDYRLHVRPGRELLRHVRGQVHLAGVLNDRKSANGSGNKEEHFGHTPSIYLDGHSATRITFRGVKIGKGDELKIVGTPDGVEPAPLDYVAVLPGGVVD
uniref:Alpha-glucuronidase n=1 Tax=Rasamsonia emersonii TaxID=68825 RepID=Q8X211_RASEM|nr:alpha-glucuronidase [Rasamsonia emersonii]